VKILFLSDNFPPETNAPATRTCEHARRWVAHGHEVTVITCVPNFPQGRVYPGYRNRLRHQRERVDGIDVVRVWSYIAPNAGFARRVLDFLSFMFSAIPAALSEPKPDVIVGTSPQFFTAVAAWIVASLRRRHWIFELRDLWPESIRAVGAMKEGLVLRALEKLELFLYHRASAVVVVTESFAENLGSRGIPRDKIHLVRNGVDPGVFDPSTDGDSVRRELGIGADEFVAAYIGTHGMAHGLEVVLDAAACTRGERIRWVLVGDGAAKPGLVARARSEGLADNLLFVPAQARERMPSFLAASDACLVLLRDEPLFRTVLPSKIFEAMAMAKPVVLGVAGESARLLTKAAAGLCIEPGNPDDLVSAVRTLAADPVQSVGMGQNGREAVVRDFDRKESALQMLRVFEAVAKRP